MKTAFVDIPKLAENHSAYTDETEDRTGFVLVNASTIVKMVMNGDECDDFDIIEHSSRPFCVWIKEKSSSRLP